MKGLESKKGYIFDLDGTLLESMGLWEDVYRGTFAFYGKTVPDGYVGEVNHLGCADGAEHTHAKYGLGRSASEIKGLWKKLSSEAYDFRVELKPYAFRLLEKLCKEGKLLGVATALDRGSFEMCLKRLGVYGFFRSFTSVGETGKDKSSPDVYLKAARKLGLKPEECVVVEDGEKGAGAAKDGGFYVVGVYDAASADSRETMMRICDMYVEDLSVLL